MRTMMKSVIAGALVSLATVAVAGVANAAPCPATGSYATLLATNAAGGCTIGDKNFSNFSYAATATGGAVPVPAAGVAYTTISPGGAIVSPTQWGFFFAGFTLGAAAGQTNDITIDYGI